MSGTAKAVSKCTLKDLKKRGDRSRARWAEAFETLQIAIREAHQLRDGIHRVHPQRRWSFDEILAFHDDGRDLKSVYPA